ncbi:MAG: hypothetical protein COB30_007810 [Ectothiorhodospiraceae bacterium]|nr:hypothetical protein [Ectothiorhodospiraceae bacterium]
MNINEHDNNTTNKPVDNQRPPIWVGHIEMETNKLEASKQFMLTLGMRLVLAGDEVVVLELRGGTHLVLLQRETITLGEVSFDLMVEDINESHKTFADMNLSPSEISRGNIHDSFMLAEPAGQMIKINSSHVGQYPV